VEKTMPLSRQIKVLNTILEREINHQLASYGLTGGQGRIVGYLSHHLEQETCQKDLEREFELSHPTMSSILSRMASKGIIVTAPLPQDKRFKTIALTEKGLELDREIHSSIENMEARLVTGFTEAEKQEVRELLHRMIQNLTEE
jgi:DNA-binding MarR family transcriptional regulator